MANVVGVDAVRAGRTGAPPVPPRGRAPRGAARPAGRGVRAPGGPAGADPLHPGPTCHRAADSAPARKRKSVRP